eukprot:4257794-Amphidinium_carterae.1
MLWIRSACESSECLLARFVTRIEMLSKSSYCFGQAYTGKPRLDPNYSGCVQNIKYVCFAVFLKTSPCSIPPVLFGKTRQTQSLVAVPLFRSVMITVTNCL